MLRAINAMIDEQGDVRLLEPARLPTGSRAIVIVLEPSYHIDASETALLSESALAEDWNRPEEDEAWSHLQQEPSS